MFLILRVYLLLSNPCHYEFVPLKKRIHYSHLYSEGLKDRGIITVTPEYVPAKFISIYSTFKYGGPQPISIIKNALQKYYNSELKFNKAFSLNDFVLYMTNNFSKTTELDIISTTVEITMDQYTNVINLNNALKIPSSSTIGTVLKSSNFIFNNITCNLKDKLISGTKGNILLQDTNGNALVIAGTIDYGTGDIYIDKQYLPVSGISIEIIPRNIKLINPGLGTLYYLFAEVTK